LLRKLPTSPSFTSQVAPLTRHLSHLHLLTDDSRPVRQLTRWRRWQHRSPTVVGINELVTSPENS
ncbi:hypothetical protein CH063_11711, partial [Colletotrichum higginsianum]